MVIRNHFGHSFPYRPSYGYLIFGLMLLIMSWENMRMDAALAQGAIPEEAIRIRILANSDSPADQAVKRHVRDAVAADMVRYAPAAPATIEEARADLLRRLPALEALVQSELAKRGFAYNAKAELGVVPFPAKRFGGAFYPAGDYEALRITLGEGKGQNWWCVLFPPLCFVDAVSGEASDAETAAAGAVPAPAAGADEDNAVEASSASEQATTLSAEETDIEVKFFIWELIRKIGGFFRGLF